MAGAARSSGVLGRGPYGASDHASFGYRTDDERVQVAAAWLADGLRAGQRTLYVAEAPAHELANELAGHPVLAAAMRAGTLLVHTIADLYDLSAPIDAAAQVAGYDATVELALRDGFDGVRVAADITPLVLDPARRDAHLRWEHVADRYMTTRPLAAACLFDVRVVGDLGPIACSHPLRDEAHGSFGVFGTAHDRTSVEGEVDRLGSAWFEAALAGIPSEDRVVDVSNLGFLDGHCAWLLQRELERRRAAGTPLAVVGAGAVVRRVWTACGFDPRMIDAS